MQENKENAEKTTDKEKKEALSKGKEKGVKEVENKTADNKTPNEKDDNSSSIKEQSELIRAKFKTYMIISLIALFTLNVIGGVFAYLYMDYRYETTLQSASEELQRELDEDLLSELKESITYDILKEYAREYYLPDNYTSTGLYVNQLARASVVELICGNQSPSVRATGIILNEEGYVLANSHAVTFATTHQSGDLTNPSETIVYSEYDMVKAILLGDTAEHEMEIIAYDTSLDLAVVKFVETPQNLESVTFSFADYTNIGEEAVVIGNALGLGISLTTGAVMGNFEYQGIDMIQTDTLALEGLSGSGVFNVNAEIIGVVSFEFTDSSDKPGVSYSISSEEIINYIDSINQNNEELSIEYTLSENLPQGL